MLCKTKQSAILKASFGRDIAIALRDAVLKENPADFAELLILSERIRICNETSNIWIAKDLHNKYGEAYDGSGRFWSCGSKLCAYCCSKSSQRNRKRLREILADLKLQVGTNLNFVTFTMPTPELALLETREIINYAWSLFRKRVYFQSIFIGGAKSEEFTINRKGYHYHLHLFAQTKYISYSKIRSEWTECLRNAFDHFGHRLDIQTADKLAIVNVEKVRDVEKGVNEVCKYLTKSDSFAKLKPEDLLDIARIRRFPRMFDLFGAFRNAEAVRAVETITPVEEEKTILDTKSVSDGEPETYWRDELKRRGASEYLDKLEREIAETRRFRQEQLKNKFPAARFWQLKPPEDSNKLQILNLLRRKYLVCPFCDDTAEHTHLTRNTANAIHLYWFPRDACSDEMREFLGSN